MCSAPGVMDGCSRVPRLLGMGRSLDRRLGQLWRYARVHLKYTPYILFACSRQWEGLGTCVLHLDLHVFSPQGHGMHGRPWEMEQDVAIVPCKICLSLLSPAQPSLLEACACRSSTHTHTARRSMYHHCDNVQCMDGYISQCIVRRGLYEQLMKVYKGPLEGCAQLLFNMNMKWYHNEHTLLELC